MCAAYVAPARGRRYLTGVLRLLADARLAAADRNYYQCWVGLKSHFDPGWTPGKAPAAEEGATVAAAVKAPAAIAVEATASGAQVQPAREHGSG